MIDWVFYKYIRKDTTPKGDGNKIHSIYCIDRQYKYIRKDTTPKGDGNPGGIFGFSAIRTTE